MSLTVDVLRRPRFCLAVLAAHVARRTCSYDVPLSDCSPVTNLSGEDSLSTSEVYVLLEVERETWPMNEGYGEETSKVVEDLNPVFDEDFEWSVPTLEDAVLQVKIWDLDTGFDDEMGKATIQLGDLQLDATPTEVMATVDRHADGSDAVAYFTMSYAPA